MTDWLITAHVASFSISLVIFTGSAMATIASRRRHRSVYSVGVVLGAVGFVTAVVLVLGGGSITRVCVSGVAYMVASTALTMLPPAFIRRQKLRE